jgi:hypothetical protein
MDIMGRTGLDETLGADHFYVSIHAGVDAYLAERENLPTQEEDLPEE